MKNFSLLLLMLASCNLFAQFSPVKESEKITPEIMRKHIEYLASDSLQGRKTGEKGQKLAASYISAQFINNGQTPASIEGEDNPWLQSFGIDAQKDFSYLKVDIEGEKKPISGSRKFLFFGKASFKDTIRVRYEYFKGQQPNPGQGLYFRVQTLQEGFDLIKKTDTATVKDFIVSLPDKEYKSIAKEYNFLMRRRLMLKIDNEDYYKVIFLKPRKVESFQLKKTLPPFLSTKPNVRIIITSEDFIGDIFSSREIKRTGKGKTDKIALSKQLKFIGIPNYFTFDTLHTENVIAKIEGTDKSDEAIVICGHYDHLGVGYYDRKANKFLKEVNNGADDNASGTSAVIEVARLFAEAQKAGYKPKRTVIFIAFTAEEEGLLGSEYYVHNPLIPISKTHAVINLDMIGRTNKHYKESDSYVDILNKRVKGKLKRMNRRNGKLIGLKVDYTPGLKERLLMNFGSDHRPFVSRDVAAVVLSTGDHPDYHTPADDADKINYKRVALITRLAFLDAWELANE